MEYPNILAQKIMREYLVKFKIFANFFNFLCMTFQVQNVSIPLNESLLITLDRNMSILLASIMAQKIMHEDLNSSEPLWILSVFLVCLFWSKMFWYPQLIYYFLRPLFFLKPVTGTFVKTVLWQQQWQAKELIQLRVF